MIARLKAWLDARLLPYWHVWYKHASMWLGALAAAAATYLLAVPDSLQWALNALPPDIRATLPAWVGPLAFGLIFLARFWKQTPHQEQDHGDQA